MGLDLGKSVTQTGLPSSVSRLHVEPDSGSGPERLLSLSVEDVILPLPAVSPR